MGNLVTIRAAREKRHFYVPSKLLILRHVKLVGGNVSSSGGSISIRSPGGVELHSCIVSNNKANGVGGGIYASGNYPHADATVYAENTILQGNAADRSGGGMFIYDGTVILTSTTFDSNSASNGGGMYISNSFSEYEVYIGGMFIDDGTVILTSTTFDSNSAADGGGGMYISYTKPHTFPSVVARVELRSTIFDSNAASNGGGMYIDGSWVILTRTTFKSNSAVRDGGGMRILSSRYKLGLTKFTGLSSVILTSTIFDSNYAGSNGGGMSIRDPASVTLTSATFDSNAADNRGGGMQIYHGFVEMRQCSFLSNTASSGGHTIYTGDATTDSYPTITVINTYIPTTTNSIDAADGSPTRTTWRTCSSKKPKPCTKAPFTGACSAVSSGNTKLGVKCSCETTNDFACVDCAAGTSKFSAACVPCPTSGCCQPGTYQLDGQCLACPQPHYCLGNMACAGNREGVACMKCKARYFAVKDSCVPCPESTTGQWIIAIGVVLVCLLLVNKMLDEPQGIFGDDEQERDAKTGKKSNEVTRQRNITSFQNGVKKSVKRSMLQSGFSILAKHTLYFSFSFSLFPFINLSEEIRQLIQSFLSLFALDLSNFVSSPACEWDAATEVKYIIKMFLPVVFLLLFEGWYKVGKIYAKSNVRKLRNKIVGVGMYLWVTNLYSVNVYQTLSAFDCFTSATNERTLDMDPEIVCYVDERHTIIIIFSSISLTFYTLIPMCCYWGKRAKQMPSWVDPRNCTGFCDGKACYDCENCDYRQRYGWFYSKYHNKCFNYEFVVILQKICVSGITLFFTIRKNISLPMLIALNLLFVGITAYYQPYLTDDEFLRIKRLGRKQASVQRNKCSKQGFGVNNNLDILLLVGETCICTASLITHNLDLVMQREVVTNNANVTLNGTASNFLVQKQKLLAKRIAKNYPVGNAIITALDILGLLVFLSGFLYFLKCIFCGKCCIQKNDQDSFNETVVEMTSPLHKNLKPK
eukprot:g342.t1